MSVLLKSRRLRRKSIIRWTLLVALLAFFVAQVKPVEGLTTPMLVGAITAAVLVPMTVIHWILVFWQGRRRRRRPGASEVSESPEQFNKFKGTQNSPVAAPKSVAPKSTAPKSTVEQHTTDVSSKDDVTVVIPSNRSPAPDVQISSGIANAVSLHAGRSKALNAKTEARRDIPASGTPEKIRATDLVASSERTASPEHAGELLSPASAETNNPEDLDGTTTTPEVLQMQVERIGHLVQTHDLGSIDPNEKDDDPSVAQANNGQTKLSLVRNDLVADTGYVDSANPLEMSQTEVVQLVATLRKDKARLHRLVIAQQAEIDTERETAERTRIVARDAFKSMRDLRKIQKNTEKQVRRERDERKRLEEEYVKVSQALENAKSIIASSTGSSASAH
ncbi:MAG: hypothetical protein AB8B97_22475 [Granulosicoccus sp.]